jgi:CRISPR-associated protein Cmr6
MVLPLYAGASCPASPGRDAHRGLIFERLFDRYVNGWEPIGKQQQEQWAANKRKWIDFCACKAGSPEDLERCARALTALVELLQGDVRAYRSDWHFATGLGLPHPVENGLGWHPTLGVPYLPGAAVKGLLRAWLEYWNEDTADSEPAQRRIGAWLGRNEGDQAGGAGRYIFFDALPLEPPTLAADVMTPHLGKWYELGGEIGDPARQPDRVPADWHDPVPVPFLVVKQARLMFAIGLRPGLSAADATAAREELPAVWEMLTKALDWLGAGAKTAVGYGRFLLDERFAREREAAIEQAAKERAQAERIEKATRDLPPDAAELTRSREENAWMADNNSLLCGLEVFLDAHPQPTPAALDLMATWLGQKWPGIMADPDAVKGRQKKPKFKDRPKSLAKRLVALQEQ